MTAEPLMTRLASQPGSWYAKANFNRALMGHKDRDQSLIWRGFLPPQSVKREGTITFGFSPRGFNTNTRCSRPKKKQNRLLSHVVKHKYKLSWFTTYALFRPLSIVSICCV
ncbi:hypothetical protein PspLS_10657 [Pyricularia sp. CBS 133598]|nr:hypothetical protein PspLS_10657 [Pyricularia sp. CBS 133598]